MQEKKGNNFKFNADKKKSKEATINTNKRRSKERRINTNKNCVVKIFTLGADYYAAITIRMNKILYV